MLTIRRVGDGYKYALFERVLDLANGGTTLAKIRDLTEAEAAQLINEERAMDMTGDFI